MAKYHSVVSLS